MSPLSIAVLLLSIALVVEFARRTLKTRIRREDTWGCGRIRHTPRMEYTSSAFAEPLRRVFAELYRPTRDLTVNVHPQSPYVIQSITYRSAVQPWFEKALYDPILRAVRQMATGVRRLQGGSVHLYLLYVALALMTALASVWWLE